MIFSSEQIIHLLIAYKYFVLFPIVVVEGPIVTVIAGFVSAIGQMNFLMAYAVVVAGDITGDVLYYAAGRFGREKFLNRWGAYLGLPAKRVFSIEKHFETHGARTLFIGKMAHGIGAIFLVAAGFARMPFKNFLGANFLATLLKSLALLLIGFYFGEAIKKINSIFEFLSLLSVSIGIIAMLAFIAYNRRNNKVYE